MASLTSVESSESESKGVGLKGGEGGMVGVGAGPGDSFRRLRERKASIMSAPVEMSYVDMPENERCGKVPEVLS